VGFTVLIPARLASSRLPDKPLADIAGLPMVVRVAQRAEQSGAAQVVVAADSPRIADACSRHGVRAVLTRADHPSGGDDLVVNVQGDEPLIDSALIDAVAALLRERPQASMSTAAHPIASVEEFLSTNVVKTVLQSDGLALYFSRAPIPWWRDGNAGGVKALPDPAPLRHIGIYGYRAGFLRDFPRMPQAPVESCEALEQLRALWHGHRIAVHVTHADPGAGVDTPEDLERVRRLFAPAA
jgi:3-deoxy-manno-octulosonate cytidylyltransferase (CMP-KDO synthetase)